MDSYPWTHHRWPTSKNLHQLCTDTGHRLEDSPEAIDDGAVLVWLDNRDDDDDDDGG